MMKGRVRRHAMAICGFMFVSSVSHAQSTSVTRPLSKGPDIDSLLRVLDTSWHKSTSPHFQLYIEREHPAAASTQLLRQLEAAWLHDKEVIGEAVPGGLRINVVVTSSRTRFTPWMSPQNRGLAGRTPRGTEFAFLVHNDSVRAYTRHEVMHVITSRVWGMAVPSAYWLVEGFATYADGRCQNTTIAAVARDILAASPELTIADVTERFGEFAHADRARAYVLAGTLAAYVRETRGLEGVKAIWKGKDSLGTALQDMLIRPRNANGAMDTSLWRAFVVRAAGNSPGIHPDSLRRFACG
jgi:hypothetical protein